jgi:hypothetical protein
MKSFAFAAFATAGLAVTAANVQAADLTPKDYMEIEQLYVQYNIAIDNGDAEGYANTFTPDGAFNRFAGRDALVAFVGTWREEMNGANRRHWNTNLRIVGTPQGADGSVSLMVLDVGTKPSTIVTTGMYNDSLVKTTDGWRFRQRTTKIDAPPVAAAPNEPSAPAVSAAKP